MYNVLVIDDNDRILEEINEVLLDKDIKSNCFNKSKEAIRHLLDHHEQYDALIVDFAMPCLSGIEFLARIRAEKIDLPVIFLSTMYKGKTNNIIHVSKINGLMNLPLLIEEITIK